jgi:hypothetical protein
MAVIGLDQFGAALAGLSALSTAAFGLLDATKAFGGGVSRIGLGAIDEALEPFEPVLDAAVGRDNWRRTVRANWINGVAKAQQKATVDALLKLGLSPETARALAVGGRVDPDALAAAAAKLDAGTPLTETDLNVLGRMSATLQAILDGAFELADQRYRNAARAWAGVIAIGLSAAAWWAWTATDANSAPSIWLALAVGLLAVPAAPIAKDLTSGLSAAMNALKAAKVV